MSDPACRWSTEHGWLSPEHLRDCPNQGCTGCKPCPKTHCAMRGSCSNHVTIDAGLRTCPRCIGSARRELMHIGDLYAVAGTMVALRTIEVGALLEEAAEGGVDSEALYLVGPAAAPEQWSEKRRRLGATFDARGWCDYPRPEGLAEDDPHHPYSVLARWDQALREQYGPITDLFVTVTSAIDYLLGLLAGPFPHGDEFEDFVKEIGACRSHMETVIHDSRTPELGRPCPRCVEANGKGPRLRKRYASGDDERTRRGDHDTWHCSDVAEHWWTEHEYRDKVAVDYLEHASELPATELAQRIGVSLSTIRKWTARAWDESAGEWAAPRLVSRRKGADGRKVYSVAAATAVRDERLSS
jgi:hypothetical protein